MYSKPAVGPDTAKPDESLGRVLDSGETRAGRGSNSLIADVLRAGSRASSKKTDEVVVRDLRRSTTELQRDTLGIALVGFEPTASGV